MACGVPVGFGCDRGVCCGVWGWCPCRTFVTISDSLISEHVNTVMGTQYRKNCIVGMIRLLADDPTFLQAAHASWYGRVGVV